MFSYWAQPEDTLDLAMYLNDHIGQVCAESPKRFVGLGTIPMQAPALAVKELRRCVVDLGLAGVQIGTNVNGLNLNDKQFEPIWEEANALRCAIFVHPWDMMGEKELKDYWLPWLVAMPAETSRAICSLIFGGVFERYPNIRFAFAHGGGSFPATIARIQHGFDVRPDLCAVDNNVPPVAYLGKFFCDSLVHSPETLQFLVSLVGARRVCLGTDYPFPLGELEPGKLIESADMFSAADRAAMLGGNALEWLGLSADRFMSAPAAAAGDATDTATDAPASQAAPSVGPAGPV